MPTFSDQKLQQLFHRISDELGEIPVLTEVPYDQYFWELCQSVMGQQLSEKVAPKIIERVKIALENDPSPQKVLATPIETLRAAGLSNAKASYLHNIANAWINDTIKPKDLQALSNEEVIQTLIQIKGIGRWTAEMFLMFTLNRPDVFSAGDYGLRRAMFLHYQLPMKASATEVMQLAEQWKPHRTLAARILWRSLNLATTVETQTSPS